MSAYCVLYNPMSGNNTGKETALRLNQILSQDQLRFVDITKIKTYPDFFASLADEERLVLAGGDGTLNRFVNDTAALGVERELYFFATGSGNDFLHDIGVARDSKPVRINKYLQHLPEVNVNGHIYKFINGIGYGIDGYCCEVGDELRKTSTKPVNYTAIAIKGLLFHFKPTNATVTVDGVKKTYSRVWLAPTMNGRFYGGGMMPTPDQDRLNKERTSSVMIYHNCGKLKALMVFPSIFKGEHVKKTKIVEILTGHEITVEFERPTALQIDGETFLNVRGYQVSNGARKCTAAEV